MSLTRLSFQTSSKLLRSSRRVSDPALKIFAIYKSVTNLRSISNWMFSTLQHLHPFTGEDKGEVSHHLSSAELIKSLAKSQQNLIYSRYGKSSQSFSIDFRYLSKLLAIASVVSNLWKLNDTHKSIV
ncbi:MAG: hypothetical protein HC778_02355 [Chamaesiphon sp. CSU_1_12]|nr:hypothetical protein [Chamaesiphon sp. CSU_1_12]